MDKQNITGQIHNVMYQNIKKKGYATPVDVLMDIGVLSKKNYEEWRFGKVDFLERVCQANLRKFEPLQERAISAAVAGKSLLAVFPTGGGKSVTFQLPELMNWKDL